MTQQLRAVVIGSGSAGEGHTLALRAAGVEVVVITSRTTDAVQRAASRLGIASAMTDWRKAIANETPDIVAIATPGGTHAEIVLEAAASGCHVFVDKPLATSLEDARAICEAVRAAGVKTAYAATARYQRGALMVRKLVADGVIGEVLEGEFVSHFHWPARLAYSWSHRLEDGGGRLNNSFTHQLSLAEMVCAGTIRSAVGDTRNDVWRAPIAAVAHDFREWARSPVPQEQADMGEWGAVDSDWAYTVIARVGSADEDLAKSTSVTFRHSCLRKAQVRNYAAFYGTGGTVHVDGAYCQGAVSLWKEGDKGFEEVPIDDEILARTPIPTPMEGWTKGWEHIQSAWNCLAQDFVSDVRGESHGSYPTTDDGLRHQEVIAAVREGQGWAAISNASESSGVDRP